MELFDQNGDEIKRENKQYKRQTETSRKEQKKKNTTMQRYNVNHIDVD